MIVCATISAAPARALPATVHRILAEQCGGLGGRDDDLGKTLIEVLAATVGRARSVQ
jgi:hypothetical protein